MRLSQQAKWFGSLALAAAIGCGQAPPEAVVTAPQAASETRNSPVIPVDGGLPADIAELVSRGDVSLAVAELSSRLEKDPQQVGWLAARSTLYLRSGAHDLALKDINAAIERQPDQARFHNNRGFVLMALRKHQEAHAALKQAMKLDPAYANPHNNEGLLLLAEGRVQEAIPAFSAALELETGYVDAYNNRGFCHMQLGQFEKALIDFNTALRIDPQYVNAINNRGLLKLSAGDADAAILDFTDAMMRDPLNPKYYLHRRQAYLAQGETDRARQDEQKVDWLKELQALNTGLSRNPADVEVLTKRARHFIAGGDSDAATADLERVFAVNPHSQDAYVIQGEMAFAEKRYEKTLSACEQALKIGDFLPARSLRGDAYLHLGEYDKALEDFVATRRIDSQVAEAYWQRSRQHAAKGASEAAAEDLARAQQLEPEIETRLR